MEPAAQKTRRGSCQPDKTITHIRSLEDIDKLEAKVSQSVELTLAALPKIIAATAPIEAFTRLKFDKVGFHPTEDRSLNLIEQINQTFTYFASLRAARWILDEHPEVFPLRLNLGTNGGFDIQSEDDKLIAETFATVDPRNNGKLQKDVQRMALQQHQYKYVFYICPGQEFREPCTEGSVRVVQLPWPVGLADKTLKPSIRAPR